MTTELAVALVALVGVVVSANVAAGAALIVDLRRTRGESRRLWLWCRQLTDHIYRGSPPPPPPAPEGLFD